jgi:hypothetical protein
MNYIKRNYKSVIIKNGHLKTVYEKPEQADAASMIRYENPLTVHPDLNGAMQRLAPHVRNISGLSFIQDLSVSGYIKVNSGDSQLLTIFSRVGEGCDDCNHKGVSTLESRIYIGKDNYLALKELLEALEMIEKEADAYIDFGKNFETDSVFVMEKKDLEELKMVSE